MKETTIFIIEKDSPVANLMKYQFLSHDAKYVHVFPTPAECLYFMHKRSVPDFLIADLTQPELNAMGLLNAVMQSFPKIKILFLSALTNESLAKQLMDNGASDYIFKSHRAEDWIRELLKNMEFLIREKARSK